MASAAFFYSIIFLAGLLIGGFVNVCADRFAGQESFRKLPFCDSCKKELLWQDQIPVISYLLLKGRCRSCGAKVSVRYPLVELASGVLYIIVFMANGCNLRSVLYCLMTSVFLVISIVDERTLEIPFPCNVFIGVIGVIVCVLDFANIWEHLIGAVVLFLILYALFYFSNGAAMGGGDVKLMTVAGLVIGWKCGILAFFLGCIIGSVCHVIRMRVSKAEHVLAMGPYLCIAIWLCALWGNDLINWYFSFLIP